MNTFTTIKKAILWSLIGGLFLPVIHVYSNPIQSTLINAKLDQAIESADSDAQTRKSMLKFQQQLEQQIEQNNKLSAEEKQMQKKDINLLLDYDLNEKLQQFSSEPLPKILPHRPKLSSALQAKIDSANNSSVTFEEFQSQLTPEENQEMINVHDEYARQILPLFIRQLCEFNKIGVKIAAILEDKLTSQATSTNNLEKLLDSITDVIIIQKKYLSGDIPTPTMGHITRISNLCFCLAKSLDIAFSSDLKNIKPVTEETIKSIPDDSLFINTLYADNKKSIWDSIELAFYYNDIVLERVRENAQLLGSPWYQKKLHQLKKDAPGYLAGAFVGVTLGGLLCIATDKLIELAIEKYNR